MNLVKRNNVLFPSLWSDIFTENRLDVPNYENFRTPAVNISENLANFIIEMAVPGMKKEDFAIEIDKEVLKVSSKVTLKEASSEADENTKYSRKEFNFRHFERSFTLPELADVEAIGASYIDGILSISLPKKEVKEDVKKMVEIS